MRDLALQAAGVLAILVAIGHGIAAEWRVFPNVRIEPKRMRTLLRGVWQASTIDWIGMGALLVAAPALGSQAARQWVIAVAVVMYGYAGVGNAMIRRGRHFGAYLMGSAVVLALMGL